MRKTRASRCGTDHLRLALFEPDIPQNTGTLLRLAACFAVAVDLIEPLGFVLDDRRLKRAALDYAAQATICRHNSWSAFLAARDPASRLILLTTRGRVPLHRFAFAADDTPVEFGRTFVRGDRSRYYVEREVERPIRSQPIEAVAPGGGASR